MLFLIFIEYMKPATTCLIKKEKEKRRAFLYDVFHELNLYYKFIKARLTTRKLANSNENLATVF